VRVYVHVSGQRQSVNSLPSTSSCAHFDNNSDFDNNSVVSSCLFCYLKRKVESAETGTRQAGTAGADDESRPSGDVDCSSGWFLSFCGLFHISLTAFART